MKIVDYTKDQYQGILVGEGSNWEFEDAFISKREAIRRGKALEHAGKSVILYRLHKGHPTPWVIYTRS